MKLMLAGLTAEDEEYALSTALPQGVDVDIWPNFAAAGESDITRYLREKEVRLSADVDLLVVRISDPNSLSILFGALRRMIEGRGPKRLYVVSSIDVQPLLDLGEPAERTALAAMSEAERFLVFRDLVACLEAAHVALSA